MGTITVNPYQIKITLSHPQSSQPNPAAGVDIASGTNPQETHFNRARASLRQALSWYSHLRKPRHRLQPRIASGAET